MENNGNVKSVKLPSVLGRIDKILDSDSSIKAFATITIAGNFMIHGIKVIEGSKGLFVSMPNNSFEGKDGQTKYSDICHSITAEMKNLVDKVVLKAYEQAQNMGQNEGQNTIGMNNTDIADVALPKVSEPAM